MAKNLSTKVDLLVFKFSIFVELLILRWLIKSNIRNWTLCAWIFAIIYADDIILTIFKVKPIRIACLISTWASPCTILFNRSRRLFELQLFFLGTISDSINPILHNRCISSSIETIDHSILNLFLVSVGTLFRFRAQHVVVNCPPILSLQASAEVSSTPPNVKNQILGGSVWAIVCSQFNVVNGR